MNVKLRVPLVAAAWLAFGTASAFAQTVNLSDSGPAGSAFQWQGPRAAARLGTSLERADMSGDVNRIDLIAGAPGAGPGGEGQVYILFMGPTWTTGSIASAASVILTGGASADQFGTSTSPGTVLNTDDAGLPRDLVVGAPGAFGGRGAVYLFKGPFALGDRRDTSAAVFRVLGAANDHLGSRVVTADLDGDGYRDIVMSAATTGRIYVVFGGPSLSGTRDLSASAADLTITVDPVAVSLAAADFNGDGFADLAVGDPAAGTAGAAYVIKGKTRAMFSSLMPISAADTVFTGVDAGDAAGTTVEAADFDGDGTSDLIVAAPAADGPGNTRASAGEVYVLFGRSTFGTSASLASAASIIYGAHAGDRLGTAIAAGNIRRDLPDDLMLLAPGASTAGDIDIVYGGPKSTIKPAIDLAAGIDRVLRGDAANAPLQGMVAMQITGKGEDIVAAAPAAPPAGTTAGSGALFAALSPTLVISPSTTTITVAQGATATATVNVKNVGTLTAGWTARTNTSWFATSPASGTATATSPGVLTLTITPGTLPPGTYHGGFSYLSNNRNLVWYDGGQVDLTVTPGTATGPRPTNLFGLPSDPDEGSPGGVVTPVGANVTVVPLRDFLVTFTNVTQAGRTIVDVQPAFPGSTGVRPGPWVYTVRTTAIVSGPVTVANAYQGFSTFDADVRIVTGSKVDVTKSVDAGLDIVYGTVSSLPQTLSIVEDRRRTVVITRTGGGSGSVQASVTPLDFDCGPGCWAFLPDTAVTFTATPASGSIWGGWSGACTGTTMTCAVTTTSSRAPIAAMYTVTLPRPPALPPAPTPTPSPHPAPAPTPTPGASPAPSDGGGGGSTPSATPTPTAPVSPVPFRPTALQSTVTGSTVTLTWAAPSAGPAPTGYVIEAGSCPGATDIAQVPNGMALSLVAPGVPDGIYYVRVRAVNGYGAGEASDEVAVVVGRGSSAPACAQGFVATSSGNDVSLRWNEVPGATAYIIEAGSTPGASNLANFSTGSPATEFHASGVPNGTYYVRVRAVTPGGVGGPSNEATLVVGGASACSTAPTSPVALASRVSGSTVTLTWGAAGGVSSYILEAGSRSGTSNLVVSDVGGSTTLTAANVGAGTYYVRVRAKNACGMSGASNEIVVTVR
jgi:FG-GAP repeat protein/BACON domain-containing protein